jgi:formylglycine-generating enzyme required for sulfatase activity
MMNVPSPKLRPGRKLVGILLIVLVPLGCKPRPKPGSESTSSAAPPSPVSAPLVPLTNMVFIKAGTFVRLKYPVTLTRDFWLSKFEVTQGEFAALMGKNPSHFQGTTNLPVEKVSQIDATAYCAALTRRETQAGRLPADYAYRLPTEAEWEYACRAGTTNFFSFGDASSEGDVYAWTAENSDAATHPIGQKRPNPWGLYDMHGNVWEWCLDWFAEYPAAPVTDPLGPPQGKFKVFRGGGWNQELQFARSRNRFMMGAANGIYFVGFRVALSKAAAP